MNQALDTRENTGRRIGSERAPMRASHGRRDQLHVARGILLAIVLGAMVWTTLFWLIAAYRF